MVCTTYKKYGLSLCHIWFATKEEIFQKIQNREVNADLVYAHGVYEEGMRDRWGIYALRLSIQPSLIKTLDSDENTVYQSYGKHLKAYIKRSQREGAFVHIFRNAEIDAELLGLCGNFYEHMKEAKGIPDIFNRKLAECYAANDALVIAMAYVNEKPVGFNAYIADKTHFRAWLTAFAFQEEEFDAQVVSRAHQLLEWETMRWCCQNGITSYDFGGIASFENPNGIDKFKMNFAKEGQRVSYDNYLVGVSLLGKLAVLGCKILKKLRK